ncbi:transketolase [Thermosediminibacter oceani]|uniref:Transketolase subunit A n=1 Tax=Thermosediminibacter oceani (strain ATCC BAA-1034 / DSM 16646 / JW/IW-1228P) TaxID=555079 RepID=D9RYL4_THEOJ|nr:transketolase [Thermosediminibacter oceani]ADL08438.1 transketolase subunit A [Thermosediminibacter oceani DSM 16646]
MAITREKVEELTAIARRVRRHIIDMTSEAGSGHPGGSLSCGDILVALYFHVMKVDPQNPDWPERDRLVLSKGHAAPALYAVLAEKGYFPVEELLTLRKINSRLQGHPDMKKTPGVDMTTGSLGQGLSAANGMAIAAKLDGKDYRVYAVLGDGELQEGQVWEAAMAASHYKLDNLTAFVDHNGLQIDGPIAEVMSPEIIQDKFRAFGWNVVDVDGHDFEDIIRGIEEAVNTKGRPTVIVAKTVKGKGVPFMENQVDWHGKAPSRQQAEEALKALEQ